MTTSRFDLRLAERLALGFGGLFVVLMALVAFTLDREVRSTNAQRQFVEEIAPRAELTRALEEAILSLAVAARSYLLTPDPSRLEQYGEAEARVTSATQLLAAAQDEARDGGGAAFAPLVNQYVQIVGRIVAGSSPGRLTPEQEIEMSRAREAAVAALRELVVRAREDTAAALAAMSAARRNVGYALVGATILMIVCFVGMASVTTRSVAVPVRELVHVAAALEAGDARPALALLPRSPSDAEKRPRDEMRMLGRAFGAAAAALERRAERLRADGEVASAAASTLDKRELADRVLRAIVDHTHAEIGVVYAAVGDEDELEPIAQYAMDAVVPRIRVGEGVPGQAVADARTVVVRDIPPDSPFVVRLGYDRAPARTAVAVPLRFGDAVHGVAVIAALRDLDSDAIAFVEAAGTQLGVGLQNASAHEQIERLLGTVRQSNQRLQAQSEELQAQYEEIQAQNEEIQAQSEEIHSQNEELQARAEELRTQHEQIRRHTAELEAHTIELQRRAALLTEADERKNEFLGLLAHELRNPLAPMTVSVYILKQAPPGSERALRAQAVIERQVRHLARLTDDLLDVTRISHGKIQIAREPLDFVDVVRSCLEDQQAAISARALRLEAELPSESLWVEGDRTRLCQVLNNLLSNASKFTEPGGRIAVRIDTEDGQAVLDVIDTGSGIEPALLPQIFQPFTQGATSLARANGGLGLGLALVKALVEMHDGSIEAHSDGPGTGSRFTLRLPVQSSRPSLDRAVAPGTVACARRILLVEDNRDAAFSLREALELQGHHVEVAHTGAEGLEKARALLPEIVLCDIGLPAMDGYEVAREIRADERLRATVLITVSGYASDHDKARASAAGFDRHLAKPLTVEALAEILAVLPPSASAAPPGA